MVYIGFSSAQETVTEEQEQIETPSDSIADSLQLDAELVIRPWKLQISGFWNTVDTLKRELTTVAELGGRDSVYRTRSLDVLDDKSSRIHQLKSEVGRYRDELQRDIAEGDSLLAPLASDAEQVRTELETSFSGLQYSLDSLHMEVRRLQSNFGLVPIDTLEADSAEIAGTSSAQGNIMYVVRRNLTNNRPTVIDFDYGGWSSGLFLVLLSLGYFYWLYRLGKKTDDESEEWKLHQNNPIWIPILKSIVLFLVLFPLTSFVVPVLVLEVSYFLIFLFMYLLLYQQYTPEKKRLTQVLFFAYIVLILASLIISDAWWSRVIMATVNGAGLVLTWIVGRVRKSQEPASKAHRWATLGILLGFTVAIGSSLLGYAYVAHTFSIASTIGLAQAMTLRAFRHMLLHDLEVYYTKSNNDRLIRRFDINRLRKTLDVIISVCCTLVILIALVNNLDITVQASTAFSNVLMTQHRVGGIEFTYGNLLLAVFVLWLSNWFQNNLKQIVNDPSSDDLHVKRMTLFPVFRLVIIVIGFLLAVSILGLSMDKLTVIIGALSVGIGLGLQTIINNFVSGIILVFEKPFKIGDYIELADRKGQVMEIGIRSSVLMTDEGARVIIPNGDLLSGRLVNWTLTTTDIRVNMDLLVTGTTEINQIKSSLTKRLKKDPFVDSSIPIKVNTKAIQADGYRISIQVGIKDVRQIERFKSAFLENIKQDTSGTDVSITSA